MDFRIELDVMEKRKICYPCRESKLGRLDRSLVAIPTDIKTYLIILFRIDLKLFDAREMESQNEVCGYGNEELSSIRIVGTDCSCWILQQESLYL
jgi:hypothetical protein